MPTYSYRCTECGDAFDIVQSFTDESLTECPSCRGRLRKVFSPVGVTFSGSGFYRTDSRPAPTAEGASTSSSASSDSSSSSGSSSSSNASGSAAPATVSASD